jgi:hypothetical protein
MKRLTTSDFIERARIKHSDRYVYDKTIYTTAHAKIIITCNLHGDFEKRAVKHLNGTGCSECGKNDRAKRKQPKGESLAELNPELAKQWHPTKNGEFKPYMFRELSNKSVWWKCDKGDDHEWEVSVSNRSIGNGCPICSGHKVVLSNCLAAINPDLAKQWHPTKNGDLTPYDVHDGSRDKVWWKCDKGDDHEWEAQIRSRIKGSGCSICASQKTVLSNCLATTNSYLAKQWHPTKNRDLTPFDFTENSGKRIWWKCDKGDDHEWESSINNRNKGSGCSICSNHTVVLSNCLATTHPELAKQWHPTENGDLTPYDVHDGSHDKVWWKCDKGDDHEWEQRVDSHTQSAAAICPFCSNMKVSKSNCLATTHPEIAKQWHPTKNGDLTPYDVIAGTHIKVWWKCDKGDDHEWDAQVKSRINHNCPSCAEHGFNPDKLSFFYVRDVKVKNKRAIKFGITNQLTGKRETKQKRGVDGSLETIFKIKVKGHLAMSIENKCKIIYGRYGYLTKEELPDGFTETIKYSEESLNKIKSIVDEVLTEKAKKKN